MFPNKKIVYIFTSLGDENDNPYIQKKSLLETLKKRFLKKPKVLKKNKSDIYQILDNLISSIAKYSEKKCFSFYLNQKDTHEKFIKNIQNEKADRHYIFPMYPQYNLEINKIANFFSLNLFDDILEKFFWIKSYAQHPIFAKAIQKTIKTVLKKNHLDEKDTCFLFLAKNPINTPLYYLESEISCQNIIKAFPYVEGILHFFTSEIQDFKLNKIKKRKNIIIIPISSIIDDYHTKKILNDFKTYLEKQKKHVFITKTLNQSSYFIRSIFDIIDDKNFISNEMLLL